MAIKRFIPDAITSMNLLCGFLGVVAAFSGQTLAAFVLMICAAVFDFFDGFAARALGEYSDLGKELDSLSDMVSFGVLPSVMLLKLGSGAGCCNIFGGVSIWSLFPALIAVFSGIRLAKFNIDPRQSSSFIGLPTPACAMICGSLALLVTQMPESWLAHWCAGPVFIPVLSVVLSFLLVCEIPMFSMKIHKGEPRGVTFYLRIAFFALAALAAVVVLSLHIHWSAIILLSFVGYVLLNVLNIKCKSRK